MQKIEKLQQVLKSKTNITPKNKYIMTIDEFWHSHSYLEIYCKFKWQAKILCQVFNKMGVCRRNGNIYSENDVFKDSYFSNCGEIDYLEDESSGLYFFEQVDLSKYISIERIETIQQNSSRKSRKIPTTRTGNGLRFEIEEK